MNVNIRPYNDADRPSLERLLRDYLTQTAEELEKAPWHFVLPIDAVMSMTFDKLEMFTPPNGQILIAIIDGEAHGTASVKMIRPAAAELKRMYVTGEARGCGIGGSLVSESVDIALKLGATEMYLDNPPPFKPAHRLYQRQGFIWTEEYPEVDIPDELKIDWLYMHKQL